MARNTGFFNRLLNVIGLVDDEPVQETPSRRVQPEDARARYGNTSSATTYSRDRQGAGSYGSTGRAAQYSQGSYGTGVRTSGGATGYSRQTSGSYASSFERPTYDSSASQSAAQQEVDELDFDYQPSQPPQKVARPQPAPQRTARRSPNVVSMRPGESALDHSDLQIFYLRTLDECRDVISDLLENKSVFLNLEDMDDRVIQRAIDTLGGAAFALGATLRRVADRTYLIAPLNVSIAYTNEAGRR